MPLTYEEVNECLKHIVPTEKERLIAGLIYTVSTTTAVILDITLLIVYFILWDQLKRTLIYKMTLSLTISSIINITVNFFTMIPCTLTGCEFYSTDTGMIAATLLETLGYYSTLLTNCVIAVERISLFFFKTVNSYITQHYKIVISVPWILGTSITVATTAMGCYKR